MQILNRRSLLRGFAVIAVLTVATCGFLGDRNSLKFRMTVDIDTPNGIKSGSSVMQAVMQGGVPVYGQINPGSYYVRGQAPYVDLGNGRFLFATLGQPMNRD